MAVLIPAEEAAKYLNVSKTTLWRLTNVEKKIKGYHIGNQIHYTLESLNEYLNTKIVGDPVKYSKEILNEGSDQKGTIVNTSI